GLRDFESIEIQPLHLFLWRGLRSVALAFSLFLTALFLCKLAEPYSRATFLFQIVGVATAVSTTRAVSIWLIRRVVLQGHLDTRRVLLIGDKANCLQFAQRWKRLGIQIVMCLPFPAWGPAAVGANHESCEHPTDDIRSIR